MGVLNDLSIIIARLPIERLIFRGPNRAEQLDRLGKALEASETETSPPLETSPTGTVEPPKATPPAQQTPGPIIEREGLHSETMQWQLEVTRAELWALEGHLKNYCKGCGPDYTCCYKHAQDAIDLARETKSMTTDPIWDRIISLGEEIRLKAHPDHIKAGTYFAEFPDLVVRISELRRPIEDKLIEITRPEITLEEAKAEAARIAAEEVEKAWQPSE